MLSTRLPELIAFFLTLIGLAGAMFLVPHLEKAEAKRKWVIIDREFIELSEEEAEEVTGR